MRPPSNLANPTWHIRDPQLLQGYITIRDIVKTGWQKKLSLMNIIRMILIPMRIIWVMSRPAVWGRDMVSSPPPKTVGGQIYNTILCRNLKSTNSSVDIIFAGVKVLK